MPQFYCYHCGQHIDAHAELSGWEVDCPACGGAITVPGVHLANPAPGSELEFDFVPLSAVSSVVRPVVEKIDDPKEPAPPPKPIVIKPLTPVATPAPTPAPTPIPSKEPHLPSAIVPEPLREPTPPSTPPSPVSSSVPTPTPEKPPKPQWEPSRKYVPVEDLREPHAPLTTLPSTVIFMVWMLGSGIAQVGIMLGAGQNSIIRDRCSDSLLFMLGCALVVLALMGLAGLCLGMLISLFRRHKVGRMGGSFCIAVLVLGCLLLGSGALWYRSGWPWLAPSLNSALAPFKVTVPAKAKVKSSDDDQEK